MERGLRASGRRSVLSSRPFERGDVVAQRSTARRVLEGATPFPALVRFRRVPRHSEAFPMCEFHRPARPSLRCAAAHLHRGDVLGGHRLLASRGEACRNAGERVAGTAVAENPRVFRRRISAKCFQRRTRDAFRSSAGACFKKIEAPRRRRTETSRRRPGDTAAQWRRGRTAPRRLATSHRGEAR